MKKIRIELCSDLCAAAGDGFGSIIDTDICTDRYGIPFIPARRIKGILRDAALYIDSPSVDKIFGVSGDSKSGSLKISDAYIANHHTLEKEIIKNNLNPEQVTELFTSVKASTAIGEDGSVKVNSLRFTRVLENSLPWDRESRIVFYADITIDSDLSDEFSDICKAVRHIGYKRNRGYGVVKCRFEETAGNSQKFQFEKCIEDRKYILRYAVRNESALMIPGNDANVTQDYISGSSVIGLLGQEYLKKNNLDEQFKSIFMNNEVKFSNLYITDENLDEFIPVPGIFGKDKTDEKKKIYNIVNEENSGKIIKPLKSGYINSSLKITKAETEIIYHNNLSTKGHGLYTQSCLSKGQVFRGSITADGKSMNVIAELLLNADIRLGRSKTAQYSVCRLESFEVSEIKEEKVKIKNKTMFVLESDVIIRDECGTVTSSSVELLKALGIDGLIEFIHPASSIKYHNISGFNTAMCMHRPHVRAFGAGSVIVCETDCTEFDSVIYIGERQNEGYGKVRIFDSEDFMNNSVCLTLKDINDNEAEENISELISEIKYREDMRQKAISYARKNAYVIRALTPSAVGRITMMTEEATDLLDLNSRIDSIRTKSIKKKASQFIQNSNPEHYNKNGWGTVREYLLIILTVSKYLKKQEGK